MRRRKKGPQMLNHAPLDANSKKGGKCAFAGYLATKSLVK